MPDKKQYDDELVQLLGRSELSDRQIAERLGLSPSQVSRIARGETRPDLQPRIYAAMRRNLKEAWKNGGRLDSDSGEPAPRRGPSARPSGLPAEGLRPLGPLAGGLGLGAPGARPRPAPGTAQTPFDRHLAVELIASGQLTLSQIARRLGIHKTTVWGITTGRTHPELQPLIREAERHYRDRARRIGVKWSAQIVMKQIQVGLKNNGWVGLRARQDLLDRFLPPEDDRAEKVQNEVAPAERDFGPELRDLPEPLKSQVVEALGGPAADDSDEFTHWVEPGPAPGPAPGAPATAAQEDPAALQKNDVAQPPSAEPFDAAPATADLRQGKPFDAAPATADLRQGKQEQTTPLQENDAAQPPSAEQEQTILTEEGCSRNKKRRRRQRLLKRRTM